MRKLLLVCTVATALVGCQDAIGPGGDCSAEMRDVRRAERQPMSTRRTGSTDITETWRYPDKVYVFRWGASYDGCSVVRTALNQLPLLLR